MQVSAFFEPIDSPSSTVPIIVALITQVTAVIILRFSVFLLLMLLSFPPVDSFPAVSTPNQLCIGLPSHHSPFVIVTFIHQAESLRIVSGNTQLVIFRGNRRSCGDRW